MALWRWDHDGSGRWVRAERHPVKRKLPEGHVLVAFVDDDGQLRELHIPIDTAHIARERGWMVFEDFEQSVKAPAESDDTA